MARVIFHQWAPDVAAEKWLAAFEAALEQWLQWTTSADHEPDGLDEEMAAIETALRDPGHDRHERSFFQQGPAGNSVMKIDDVVAWASTDRGGKQMPLFSPIDQAATDGCMRWGMCEVAADEPEDGGTP